jgi:hypothetical protein
MPVGYKTALVNVDPKSDISAIINKLDKKDVYCNFNQSTRSPRWTVTLSQTIIEGLYGSNKQHYCGDISIEVEASGKTFSSVFRATVKKFLDEQKKLPQRYEKEKKWFLDNH